MITRNDVVRLLALAARGDQRTVGEDDVDDWHTIAQMQRWTAKSAARVIMEHRASGADKPRITPAAISDRIRTLRGKAAESFELPVVPDSIPTADYPQWLRDQLANHVDTLLNEWATSGTEPPRAIQPPPAQIRSLPELIAAAPDHARDELHAGARRLNGHR